MSPTTLNERLILIGAGEKVMTEVASGRLEPKAIVTRLLDKARGRGNGVTEELKRPKNDIPEPDVTDAALHAYVTQPDLTAKDIERDITSVPIKLATARLRKRLALVVADAQALAGDFTEIPDPNALRSDIAAAIRTLKGLDEKIAPT